MSSVSTFTFRVSGAVLARDRSPLIATVSATSPEAAFDILRKSLTFENDPKRTGEHFQLVGAMKRAPLV